MRTLALLPLLLAFAGPAQAGTLAGVTMPDSSTVAGQPVVLNGMGLREKYFIDVYVGGMYLPAKTTDADKAIKDDVPKRIDMKFVYTVDQGKMVETFREGLAKLPNKGDLAERFQRLEGMMQTADKGDLVAIEYVPGKGTSFSFNGTSKGTIEGVDFMRAIWTIYLGPNPPTANLKKGLLGL